MSKEPKAILRKPRELTRKQKAFVKYLIDNPKASGTQAAIHAYDDTTYNAAAQIATDNLKKPQVLKMLNDAVEEAEGTILDVMRSSKALKKDAKHAAVAKSAAESVIDRIHGRPTTHVQAVGTVVTIGLDLTSISS